jgi:hypothetical protein
VSGGARGVPRPRRRLQRGASDPLRKAPAPGAPAPAAGGALAPTFFLPLLLLAAAMALASFDFWTLGACGRGPGRLSTPSAAAGPGRGLARPACPPW